MIPSVCLAAGNVFFLGSRVCVEVMRDSCNPPLLALGVVIQPVGTTTTVDGVGVWVKALINVDAKRPMFDPSTDRERP